MPLSNALNVVRNKTTLAITLSGSSSSPNYPKLFSSKIFKGGGGDECNDTTLAPLLKVFNIVNTKTTPITTLLGVIAIVR
jgi:hypothetical protein